MSTARPASHRGVEDFVALRGRSRARWLGLMSGTSCDGIDAALVELEERPGPGGAGPGGSGGHTTSASDLPVVRAVCGRVDPFPDELRARLRSDLTAVPDAACAARWDCELGERFASAALRARRELGDCDAIALSGHTLAHLPREGVTLQIGNPAVVAERTGAPVVAGFRAADIARGGEGAPLVPVGDRVLFGGGPCTCVLNIGGVSNITLLPEGGTPPRARDCGPGNLVLDELVRAGTGGVRSIDRDGQLALRGRAHGELVARWLDHPFFHARRAPRSTGREEFGEDWARARRALLASLPLEDRLATACRWIAACIATAVEREARGGSDLDARPRRLLIGGGGAHNRALVIEIERALELPAEVLDASRHAVSADLREAAAFAILGHEFLHGRPGSYPSTTGCRAPGPLGALWLPSTRASERGAAGAPGSELE